MAENVHNLKKETHIQVQEAQSFKLVKWKENQAKHIIV